MRNLSIFLLIGLVCYVTSRDPKPCKTPDQWEGKYYSYDALRRIRIVGTISYDAINKRERVFQTIIMKDKNQTYDLVYNYKENTLTVLDLTQKSCSKLDVKKPWKDFGVPKDAVYFGKNYYGSASLPNDGLLVSTWKNEYVDPKGNNVFHVSTWTYNSCLPVLDSYVSDEYSLHCLFMDITPGVKNESVFNVQEECEELQENEEENEEESEENEQNEEEIEDEENEFLNQIYN